MLQITRASEWDVEQSDSHHLVNSRTIFKKIVIFVKIAKIF